MAVFSPFFFLQNGGKSVVLFSYAKEDTAIALVFMMYDGS